ncbi:hypothetical protein E4T51_05533 [Aureobasidium sp. EXF-12344]|nr:hypothetical protein E4T51_05533 [Aureobasidium sp. EXF-12344]
MYIITIFLCFLCVAIAQTVLPFAIDGRLDGVTVTDTTYNSGGTAAVNGWTITVPQNLLVQFPAAFKPWRDLSGFVGSEVSITGNVVNGVLIAGLISISQYILETNSGLIESIDNSAGTIKIQNGPTIRINDPNGVYGAPYTTTPDFTADDQNPSITDSVGFPMCIPRSATTVDPLCPSTNRPAGQTAFNAPDPLVMAPFAVGDYLVFSGINVGGTIVCYSITALNVQILTPNGPTYVKIEDAIIGVFSTSAAVELTDSRFIGYSTNPAAPITMWALDLDPCTGAESERAIGSALYKAGDPRNKWIWRTDTRVNAKYTREYVIRANSGVVTTKNNLTAGRFVQPVTDYIFPESLTPGATPPANDFSNIGHLAQGVGYTPDGVLIGQLNPWPGASGSVPAAPVCPPFAAANSAPPATSSTAATTPASGPVAPVLSLPAAITTRPGVSVPMSFNVTNAASFATSDLAFSWSQISGPVVTLSPTNGQSSSFITAQATTLSSYIFKVTATSTSFGTTTTGNITVISDLSIPDVVVIDAYTASTANGGQLTVSAHTNIVGYDAHLKVFLATTATGTGTPMTPVTGKPGSYFYNAPKGTKKPAGIFLISDGGGNATTTATTA